MLRKHICIKGKQRCKEGSTKRKVKIVCITYLAQFGMFLPWIWRSI